jgi:hypothetical protein
MKLRHASYTFLLLAAFLAGSGVETADEEGSAKAKASGAGAMAMQDRTPIDQAHLYVCGFHFVNGDMTRQVEAHHYCIMTSEDLAQCVIFSGNGKDAKLIGIEYIISPKLFATLPEDERRLWHSHDYEVASGQLIAPGLPDAAEHELMGKLASTYGKTVHTWQVDRGDPLPLGPPQVMMGSTGDGQIRAEMVRDRDRRFGISSEEKRKSRSDIPPPKLLPGVNAWRNGKVVQLELKESSATKGAP